jgi:hypothetical protein
LINPAIPTKVIAHLSRPRKSIAEDPAFPTAPTTATEPILLDKPNPDILRQVEHWAKKRRTESEFMLQPPERNELPSGTLKPDSTKADRQSTVFGKINETNRRLQIGLRDFNNQSHTLEPPEGLDGRGESNILYDMEFEDRVNEIDWLQMYLDEQLDNDREVVAVLFDQFKAANKNNGTPWRSKEGLGALPNFSPVKKLLGMNRETSPTILSMQMTERLPSS